MSYLIPIVTVSKALVEKHQFIGHIYYLLEKFSKYYKLYQYNSTKITDCVLFAKHYAYTLKLSTIVSSHILSPRF